MKVGNLDNTVVLCVSRDLPFAKDSVAPRESMILFHISFKDGSFGKIMV
jgi:peroxiredoxin